MIAKIGTAVKSYFSRRSRPSKRNLETRNVLGGFVDVSCQKLDGIQNPRDFDFLHQPSGLSNSAFAKQNATHDLRVARIGLKVKPTPEILFPPTFLGIQLDFCEAKWRPYFLAAKSWMGYKIHGILYLPRFHNQPHGGTLLAVDFNFRESRRTD